MLKSLLRAFLMVLWMTLILGIAYPLLITGIAYVIAPQRSGGSFLSVKDKIVGSKLIAQPFTKDYYFWPRPSAINFNPLPSGGSNLGPTSTVLKKLVDERRSLIAKAHDIEDVSTIPSELLYASGSGLDPHIKTGTAFFQLNRVAKARQLSDEEKTALRKLILKFSREAPVRYLGTPCVNVLELNIALDELKPMP